MKKQPELTAQTRENLLEAFWGLYCQKKIDHITVKAITDKAGYHRSTFYEYFVDVYDILDQLEGSLLQYIKENVLKSLEVEQQNDVTRQIAELYESQGNYLSILLGENGDPYFVIKLKTVMRPVLLDAFGLSGSEVHTAYIFEFAFAAIIATLTHWYQSNKSIASVEVIFMIRTMLASGALPMIHKYTTTNGIIIRLNEPA